MRRAEAEIIGSAEEDPALGGVPQKRGYYDEPRRCVFPSVARLLLLILGMVLGGCLLTTGYVIGSAQAKEAGPQNKFEAVPAAASTAEKSLPLGLSPWQIQMALSEKRTYSQSYQDGILDFLFQELGTTNNFYVEFGFNSQQFDGGSGANSYNLYKKGWKGLLLDGGAENLEVNLHKELLGPHGIAGVFQKYSVPKEPDYVSVDFDSYDLWTLKAIVTGGFRPRIVTIEYMPAYPHDSTLCLNYPEQDAYWPLMDGIYGASLGAIELLAKEIGYTLVYAVSGLDAFLVRSDLLNNRSIAITSLLDSPTPERLVDNSTRTRCRSKESRLTLGGNPTTHLGYWCRRNWNSHVTVNVKHLEDYAVFQKTGDHAAAKAAAMQNPFVKALLRDATEMRASSPRPPRDGRQTGWFFP